MQMMPRGHQRQPALPQIQTIDLDQASRPAPRFSPGVHSHNVDNIELCPLSNHPGIVAPAGFKLFHDKPDGLPRLPNSRRSDSFVDHCTTALFAIGPPLSIAGHR